MKKKCFFIAVISVMAFTMNGQVHIGGNTPARNGAILDLTNAGNLGLKLPLVDLQNDTVLQLGPPNVAGLKNDTTATGMTVYNTNKFELDGEGVYTWNGSKWTTVWAKGKIDGVVVPTPTNCQSNFKNQIVFMKYNLGADPTYDTPKKQMEYLVRLTNNEFASDQKVLGGLYQWGRKDLSHGNRHTTLQQGQTDTPADGTFYCNTNDWREHPKDDLWGNGVSIDTPTNDGIFYNDSFYQKPVKTANDPCPSGFRVPTQDEWERIGGNYDCRPDVTSDKLEFRTGMAKDIAATNLVWVRVNYGKALSDIAQAQSNIRLGYAIYYKEDWNNADPKYKDGTAALYEDAAPEPILFLPAGGTQTNGNGIYDAGTNLYYWSSSICNDYAYCLFFRMLNSIEVDFAMPRAQGCSIRCVAE